MRHRYIFYSGIFGTHLQDLGQLQVKPINLINDTEDRPVFVAFDVSAAHILPVKKKCHMTCQVGSAELAAAAAAAATRDAGRGGTREISEVSFSTFPSRYDSTVEQAEH